MKSRKVHRIIGLMLILPMIGWVITGFIFFTKPGYQGAFDQLAIKTYPLQQSFVIEPASNWLEAKVVRTILGHHLLVKTRDGFAHLDPISYQPKEVADNAGLQLLINDTFSHDSKRYGVVSSIEGHKALTNTGVEVTVNWTNLTLRQSGQDTKLIDLLYKIHYLQWTWSEGFNQIFGFLGLVLLILLTLFGIKIFISPGHKQS
ncbi:hypothetical protein Q4574_10915 [Aliiglaciecola sp. 3_MG-2023]|uniref:hypothetical protein n=1 Tax=Aliiglaciecola sp. 3_MG-2023 TaxID=3062644 RepID=UPI0026E168BC|nr:hypothetical protein [Aliiglaciecola sp. 3_MG-2023]MDO6693800.1 hypothetical protein [Aliiglaciecola sp. 3_MG-2023]